MTLCCSAALGSHCFTVIGSSVIRGLMWPSGERICAGYMPFWRNRMRNLFVDIIAGALGRWRHVCHSHPVQRMFSMQTVQRMFLLGTQLLIGQSPGPSDLAGQCGGGGRGLGHGFPTSVGSVHRSSADGLGASSFCGAGRRASSSARALGDIGCFASVAGYKSAGYRW